jgi:CHAT domain-containing protein/lipopolysaccharide biosynthesis regulator YciM
MPDKKRLSTLFVTNLIFFSFFSITYAADFNLLKSLPNALQDAKQTSKEFTKLPLNKILEKELSVGEVHYYEIELKANDYLNLLLEQKGVDVELKFFSPSNELVKLVDSPNGKNGKNLLEIIVNLSGIYKLEVNSSETTLGQYSISIMQLHPATDKDKEIVKAKRLAEETEDFRKKGKYDEALPLISEAVEISRRVLGEEDFNTGLFKSVQGLIYFGKGEYKKTEELYLQALEIFSKTAEESENNFVQTKSNLAKLYFEKGDYKKAEELYLQILEIKKKFLGENHQYTARVKNDLATFYTTTGNYKKAEILYLDVLEVYKKSIGENDVYVARVKNDLGLFYFTVGDYKKAEDFYKQSSELYINLLGREHPDVAISINNLATFYLETGEYAKAEPLYIEVLQTKRKRLGVNHPSTATSINNLAILYSYKDDYTKAETLYLEALEIRKKVLGENHQSTANSINTLAKLYSDNGDYTKAKALYLEALEIRKKVLGENHQLTANSITNLAQLYAKEKDYTKAKELYLKAKEIYIKNVGENHPLVANSLNSLAGILLIENDYKKAEELLFRALEIRKEILGDSHPYTTTSLNTLALFYEKTGDLEKAIKFRSDANEAREKELNRNLSLGSEKSKLLYLQKYADEIDFTLSLHLNGLPDDQLAIKTALTQILRGKGRSLDAINLNIESLRKMAKAEDLKLLDELSQKKKIFSDTTLRGLGNNAPETYKKKLKELQDEIELLEYKISQVSIEFGLQNQITTLQAVQSAIDENTVLIEFFSYRPFDAKEEIFQKRQYVAYLLEKEGTPRFISLGDASTIDLLVEQFRTELSTKQTSTNREIKSLARKLDEILMAQIRKLIGNKKHLLISPDGKLNLIPFAALVDSQGKFLIENYLISYLTSGRDLLRLQFKIQSKTPFTIIADPDYGSLPTKLDVNKEKSTVFSQIAFKPLVGTRLEAIAIKELFANSEVFLQTQATEENLNKVNSPLGLHIATHGFFLDEKELSTSINKSRKVDILGYDSLQNRFVKIDNPLLRSGIALAGANVENSEREKGIFTALKATSLNLWGTKLVVLSACDTGVGEVRNGDGIYGLRRAFVLAGSETQVMTLWPVSDVVTKNLMVSYYSKLKKGIGRANALRQAQLELLKQVHYKTKHPFYWASFISSGEWANLNDKR